MSEVRNPRVFMRGVVAALLVIFVSASLSAADISAGLSNKETYVGLPVTLQIRIENAQKYDSPEIPDVDGLEIRSTGAPMQSSQTFSFNGRVTKSTSVTLSYQVTPRRAGTFTIPPLTVKADGLQKLLPAMRLVATKSETGDLLFVEIAGKQDHVYVGQSLELTLKIWLRPYQDREQQVTLSEGNMWGLISSQTEWGQFAETIESLAANNQRPAGEEVLRDDGQGTPRSYYLYEIDATIYPKKPGNIDGRDVQVVVSYPTALGKSRDPFDSFFSDDMFGDFFSSSFRSRLRVTSVRPIVAEAKVEPINVKPIPSIGRPADYRGAVGKYEIVTDAKPTSVKAGDPITLHVGITGSGPMDLVQAPPLAELPDLTADFRVPDEPLAGFVEKQQKLFSTSIRPRKEGVTEIPAIPFSYFDPDTEQFVTVRSEPIAIQVEPADTLALDAIVGKGRNIESADPQRPAAEPGSAPSFTNFYDDELLQSESPTTDLAWRQFWPFALPPLVFILYHLVRARSRVGGILSSLRSPMRELQSQIEHAEQGEDLAAALTTFLNRRIGISERPSSHDLAMGELRRRGLHDLAVRFERLINQCGQREFGVRPTDADGALDRLKEEMSAAASELNGRLKRTSRGAIVKSKGRPAGEATRVRSTGTTFLLACCLVVSQTSSLRAEELSIQQRRMLLADANELYQRATSADAADRRSLAAAAAEKYELLVDSKITNAKLYFNLANAYHKSGQFGRAIANYHRAIQIDPTNSRYRINLDHTRELIQSKANNQPATLTDPRGMVDSASEWLSRHVDPKSALIVALSAWSAFWASLLIRSMFNAFPWKSAMAVALCVFLPAAGALLLVHRGAKDRGSFAIVVEPSVELRSGDGSQFPSTARLADAEGTSVTVLQQRGKWTNIQAASGQIGWLPTAAIEVI